MKKETGAWKERRALMIAASPACIAAGQVMIAFQIVLCLVSSSYLVIFGARGWIGFTWVSCVGHCIFLCMALPWRGAPIRVERARLLFHRAFEFKTAARILRACIWCYENHIPCRRSAHFRGTTRALRPRGITREILQYDSGSPDHRFRRDTHLRFWFSSACR